MTQTLTLPAIAPAEGSENFVVTDCSGYADFADSNVPADKRKIDLEWCGDMGFKEGLKAMRDGDLAAVPASDKLLGDLESLVPMSRAFRTVDSVVGSHPNIPAYLAGVPVAMRLRKRVASPSAPLAIMVELVASAGVTADQCRARGVAMLALVRMLANIRPVELWAVIAIGENRSRSSILIRLDTSPLDLARAAHVLTHPNVFRGLGYRAISQKFYDGNWGGHWGFNNADHHRKTARESYLRVIASGSDVLFIPPMHLSDRYLTAPVQWLKSMLATHGGIAMDGAA